MRTTFKMLRRAIFGIFRDHNSQRLWTKSNFFDPSHANRVHVFHGTFVSELATDVLLFDAPSRNGRTPHAGSADAMIDDRGQSSQERRALVALADVD
jgi:hypothetical protein